MNKKIGFISGPFNLNMVSSWHILMLKKCKEQCDYLIVAIPTDNNIEEKLLKDCGYVDQIMRYKAEKDLYHMLQKLYNVNGVDVRFIEKEYENIPDHSRDLLPQIPIIYI